ncbi:MAG: NUDIX hydrolase [Symbiobacterium sp.]|uniref:NUDIX hydrolase n=1 Tax=Symbiobacterium sp. TaxID=1971213 RepID=UPI0034642BE1
MTGEVLARAEAALGTPAVLTWRCAIGPEEMAMVVASTRGQQRLHDVTLFIFNPAGQVALIRKHHYPPGVWRAPGGGVNPGEELADGAAREAWEETGLSVRVTRYLLRVHVVFTCGDREQPWTTHVVLAEAEGVPSTHDPREIAAVRWGSLAELCGPIADAMRATGRGLFKYRAALHEAVARLL